MRLLVRKQANAHWSKTICQSSFLSNPFCCVHDEPTKKCRSRYVHCTMYMRWIKNDCNNLKCAIMKIFTQKNCKTPPFHSVASIPFYVDYFSLLFSLSGSVFHPDSPSVSFSISPCASLSCLSIFLALCDSRGKLKQVH